MSAPTIPDRVDDHRVRSIERFLYDEAALLDAWRLQDWLELLSDDCTYHVPTTDAINAQNPRRSLFIIADDHDQIVGRVNRLESEQALVERPRSRTRRQITNVRVNELNSGRYEVQSNFVVYRFRRDVSDIFVGEYHHLLTTGEDGGYRITHRRATLDSETLRPQGKISFIL